MSATVTSAFLYVDDLQESIDFYTEVLGAEIGQLHAETEDGPLTLAILRIGGFSLMLHPQDEISEQLADQRPGIGIHLQMRVDDVNAFYDHCMEQGAMMAVSGEPVDQEWGWRELAIRDPDGYVWSVYQDMTDGQWS